MQSVAFHSAAGSKVSSQPGAMQPPQETMECGDPQDSQLPVVSSSSRTDTTAQVSEARAFVNPQEPGQRPAGASSQPAARQAGGATQEDFEDAGECCLGASFVPTLGLMCAGLFTKGSTQATLFVSGGVTLVAGVCCCVLCHGMGAICPDAPSHPQ